METCEGCFSKMLDSFPIYIAIIVSVVFNFAFTKINYFRIPVMIFATFIRYSSLSLSLSLYLCFSLHFGVFVSFHSYLFSPLSIAALFFFFHFFFVFLFNLSILMPNIFFDVVAEGNFQMMATTTTSAMMTMVVVA